MEYIKQQLNHHIKAYILNAYYFSPGGVNYSHIYGEEQLLPFERTLSFGHNTLMEITYLSSLHSHLDAFIFITNPPTKEFSLLLKGQLTQHKT